MCSFSVVEQTDRSCDLCRGVYATAHPYLADSPLAVLQRADGRCARLRRVGTANRERRLDGPRSVLAVAALSLLSWLDLLACRAQPDDCARRAGRDRVGLVRAPRHGGRPALFYARRSGCGSDARHIRAGDLLRRPAAEVGARRVFRLPGTMVDSANYNDVVEILAVAGAGSRARRVDLDS